MGKIGLLVHQYATCNYFYLRAWFWLVWVNISSIPAVFGEMGAVWCRQKTSFGLGLWKSTQQCCTCWGSSAVPWTGPLEGRPHTRGDHPVAFWMPSHTVLCSRGTSFQFTSQTKPRSGSLTFKRSANRKSGFFSECSCFWVWCFCFCFFLIR